MHRPPLLRPLLLSLPVAAAVLALFLGSPAYAQSQLAFVALYALAGLGLHLIVGQCGQISLGHGALLGLGAYAGTLSLGAGGGVLAMFAAAALAGALGGLLAALPAGRLGGLYFGMATLAFGLLVEEGLIWAERWTGGNAGLAVPPARLGDWSLATPLGQMSASVGLFLLALFLVRRLNASRLGRAWRAIREDEAAAAASGIDTTGLKLLAFACGGTLAGLAGALYAQSIGFLGPEQFGMQSSFELLILVFLGATRRPQGTLIGAGVVVALPQAIVLVRDLIPGLAASAGLETIAFGVLIVATALRLMPRRP